MIANHLSLMFSVGQKVVLVDDKWPETVKQLYLQLPVLDTVYVVRAVRVGVKVDELIMVPVHQRALRERTEGKQYHPEHEQKGKLLGQRAGRTIL